MRDQSILTHHGIYMVDTVYIFVLTHSDELIGTESKIAGCSDYLHHIKKLSGRNTTMIS